MLDTTTYSFNKQFLSYKLKSTEKNILGYTGRWFQSNFFSFFCEIFSTLNEALEIYFKPYYNGCENKNNSRFNQVYRKLINNPC